MHDQAAFLRTIAGAPDDDTPRLVYADWLQERGDPRGSFIRVQCALAALPIKDPRRTDLEDIERELSAAHVAVWSAELNGAIKGAEFRRGFIEGLSLSAASFLEHGSDLLTSGLVRTIRLLDCADAIADLVRCPLLRRVAHLDVGVNYLGDEKTATFLRSEHVRDLRGLGLSFNGLTNAGVQAVLDAGSWSRLTALDLQGNAHVTGRGAVHLAQSRALPALEALDLRDNLVNSDGTSALAKDKTLTRLADLALSGNPLGDAGCRALALSPLLPRQLARTDTLDLRASGLTAAGIQSLVTGDRLRAVVVLNLNRNKIGDAGLVALSIAGLPRLRELHLAGNEITDEGASALAGAPVLGRLRVLDLADNLLSPGGRVALMTSPYWHWRTDIDVTNRPRPSIDEFFGDDDAPIGLDCEED